MQETKLKNQEKEEERLYMATTTTGMSPKQKPYCVSERRRIQAEKAAAEAAELEGSDEDGEEKGEEEAAA